MIKTRKNCFHRDQYEDDNDDNIKKDVKVKNNDNHKGLFHIDYSTQKLSLKEKIEDKEILLLHIIIIFQYKDNIKNDPKNIYVHNENDLSKKVNEFFHDQMFYLLSNSFPEILGEPKNEKRKYHKEKRNDNLKFTALNNGLLYTKVTK